MHFTYFHTEIQYSCNSVRDPKPSLVVVAVLADPNRSGGPGTHTSMPGSGSRAPNSGTATGGSTMRWQFEAEAGATGHALTTGREEYEQTGDVPDQAEPRIEVHGIDVRSHPSQHSDCTSAVAPQHRQLNSTGCNASARRAVLSVGAVAMTLLVIAIPFSDNPVSVRASWLLPEMVGVQWETDAVSLLGFRRLRDRNS